MDTKNSTYNIYKRKRTKKILLEVLFWISLLIFFSLAMANIVLIARGENTEQAVAYMKIFSIIQTIMVLLQIPLTILKIRTTVHFLIVKNKRNKKNQIKEIYNMKHNKAINEPFLKIKTLNARKDPQKQAAHNEKIANAIYILSGEFLRGAPYYELKELMNNNDINIKDRQKATVDLLLKSNVKLTDDIKILIKSIA